jgi:hypothetical protein
MLMLNPLLDDLRLVGGTALALQIGHRKSVDLDLFGIIDFGLLDINELFHGIDKLTVLKSSKNINVFSVNDIKVDIVNYSYPWIGKLMVYDNIRMAAIEDIAAMKLAAITGRGSKKDFIDIHYLLQRYTLSQILGFYKRKFQDGSVFLVLKSLTYFEDAEAEPMPFVFEPLDWSIIKQNLQKQVYEISLYE